MKILQRGLWTVGSPLGRGVQQEVVHLYQLAWRTLGQPETGQRRNAQHQILHLWGQLALLDGLHQCRHRGRRNKRALKVYGGTQLRHETLDAKLLQLCAGLEVEGGVCPLDVHRTCQRAIQARQGRLPVAHRRQVRLLEAYMDLEWRLDEPLGQGELGERQIDRQEQVQRRGLGVSLIQTPSTLQLALRVYQRVVVLGEGQLLRRCG